MSTWSQKGPPDREALQHALLAFVNSSTVDEAVSVLEQFKTLLLTDAASKVLQWMIETSRKANPEDINNLEQHQRLLERARLHGPQKAGQEEQRHLDEVRDTVIAFLQTDIATIRQFWEQHRQMLLTTEAIRRTRRMIEQIKGKDSPEEPWWHWRRELYLRFLEDARTHELDYAMQQFVQGFRDIVTRMRLREPF